MNTAIMKIQTEIMLEQSGYDAFAVMERINNLYSKGILTKREAFAMIDVLTPYFQGGVHMKMRYRLYVAKCRLRHEEEMNIIDWICAEMRKENY